MSNNTGTRHAFRAALVALAIGAASSLYADETVLQAFINTRDTSPTLTLGRTRSDLTQCIKWAEEYGIPLVAIWSNEGCAHCERLERAMTSEAFLAHARKSGLIICAIFNSDGKGTITKSDPEGARGGEGYQWCWGKGNSKIYKSISMFPFVRFYWKKDGKQIVDTLRMGDQVDGNTGTDVATGTMTDELGTYSTVAGKTANKAGIYSINYMIKMFPGYVPVALNDYVGGEFAVGPDTENDRLEAEAGTTNVTVSIVRDAGAGASLATNILSVTYPTKSNPRLSATANAGDTTLVWAAGETTKDVNVPIDASALSDGDAITLVLKDEKGVGHDTNHIWYVENEVSAGNPLWIGEKKDLGFGEWTMDLDAAKKLVSETPGQAYTLVLLEGSLWCGDCKNVEGSFLSAKDGSGNNVFEKWAKDNNVALVAIDCPMYTNKTDYARPTLLSRDDVRGNGISGRGYLTRKMVDDETAAAVLERNHQLTVKNTAEGGFHRPEDANEFRTGVPFFVMLRKDGTVAARLTRWAAVSTTALNANNFEAFYSRFNEMLAMAAGSGEHAEAGEIENGYPGAGAASFKANGGSASGELSHCDMRDVFRLDGVGGNAIQRVVVKGSSSAKVKVSFLSLASGKAVQVGDAVTGKLSDGVSLEYTFTAAGEYFVLVEGSNVADAEWAVENKKADNFVQYSVSGDVVLVPQEVAATADGASGTVVMKLEKGVLYRIDGLDETSVAASLATAGETPHFFKALADGNANLKTLGGTVTYQKWNPGTVGFDAEARTVDESAGDVIVTLSRTGGTSGSVTVEVSLDAEATKHEDSEGKLRYKPFVPVSVTWDDGKAFTTNVIIALLDDEQFDGPGKMVLNLAVTAQVNGDIELTNTVFTLSVRDNDKSAPGVVSFVESGTVYCKESVGATVHAVRKEATDGDVSVSVSTTAGTLAANTVTWDHRDSQAKQITLTGLAAGKTATLTLKPADGGVKVLNTARTIKVVSVSKDGPEFDRASETLNLTKNVAVSHLAEVDTQTFPSGSQLLFTKKSGTLPPGLTAKWNGESALLISGTPTRAGEWTAVYQVSSRNGGKTETGLVTELTFKVVDPAAAGADGSPAVNPAVATTRTLKDVMILDDGVLKGLLQVTIPPTGRASAKYMTTGKTISLSSQSWSAIDSGTGALSTTLAGVGRAGEGWALDLTANADGTTSMKLTGPEGLEGEATTDGKPWSASNKATDYEGYYTVTLPTVVTLSAETPELVATGAGYLTIKIQGASNLKSGIAKWAGMLPNGTAISGTAVLTDGEDSALMPVFKSSSKDTISGVTKVMRNALKLRNEKKVYEVVTAPIESPAMLWRHDEPKDSKASFEVGLGVHGCLYVSGEDLEICCSEFFDGQTDMWLFVEGMEAFSSVKVAKSSLALDKTAGKNGLSATLGFNASTGVASGTFKVDGTTMKWKGVVLVGLGGCSACSAGEGDPGYPLVNGAFYCDLKLPYETTSGSKTVKRTTTIKVGGGVKVDVSAFE